MKVTYSTKTSKVTIELSMTETTHFCLLRTYGAVLQNMQDMILKAINAATKLKQ